MAADAIVIGAGAIGGAIAWRLAQRGLAVTLLDAGRMGGEASWAAAGMLAPGGEIRERTPWLDFALESLRLYPAFVAELAEASGRAIDYQRRGALEVALSDEEHAELDARAGRQIQLGIPSEPLPLAELRLPGARVAGVRYFPADDAVSPRDLVRALRSVCAPWLREGVRVRRIEATAERVTVTTDAGPLEAGRAVLAAGAWSSGVEIAVDGQKWTGPEVYPVRGHLFSCELPTGALGSIVRRGHTYLLQRASGIVLVGASSEEKGFDRRVDPEIVAGLRTAASAILPIVERAEMVERWLGFRPATRDGEPAVGRVGRSALWVAYGHYRNGILLTPATAARVAAEAAA